MTRSRLATAIVSLVFLFIIGTNLYSMHLEAASADARSGFIPRRKASVELAPERILVYGPDASVIPRDASLPEPDVPDAGKTSISTLSGSSDGGVDDLITRWLRVCANREDRCRGGIPADDLESP